MIIKKKFTNVKKLIEETPIVEETLVENDKKEQPQISDAKNAEEQEPNIVPQVEEPPKKDVKNDFDSILEDIKFEQREERREGSRRRGYRRTQDRNIVSRAQNEAVTIKEAAKHEGYNDGLAKAQADIDELRSKFDDFYTYKDEVYDKVSGCIMDIALEIAKKIINKEVETDREVTLSIIKGAVEEVNQTENKIVLKVMPKDVEIVRDKVPEIFSGNFYEAKISVIPDASIKEGGVIIETSNGLIDASIETQLAIIEKALMKKEEN